MGGGPEIKDRLLCVLPFAEPKEIIEGLRKKFPHIEVSYIQLLYKPGAVWENQAVVPPEQFRDKTILATLSALPASPADCPNLDLIHVTSAGTNHIANHVIYKDTSITLTTSSGIHGPQIAEWVLMTYLVHSHKYNQLYELQKSYKWGKMVGTDSDYNHVRDLVGQRLGVLGYGSIGRQVAHVAKAMGMDVIAFTATPKDTAEKKKDHGFIVPGTGDPDGSIPSAWYSGLDKESLHGFLKQDIDFLLISVPLTKETTHLLSTAEFNLLSKSSSRPPFISNISRGAIIDQPALITALENGDLRGAAVDVTSPEPLPEDDPLWKAPNLIITPHVSGIGVAYVERAFKVLEENLGRRERGERLINIVDRERGY